MDEKRLKEKKKGSLIKRGHEEDVSKDIKDIFKLRQTDERRSGGNQGLTRVKFKNGVMKTEGKEYQRGLRTKTWYMVCSLTLHLGSRGYVLRAGAERLMLNLREKQTL